MSIRVPWTHAALLAETVVPWILVATGLAFQLSDTNANDTNTKGKGASDAQAPGVMLTDVLATITTGATLVMTAASTIHAGAWRSIKGPDHKPEDVPPPMTKSDAMRFPLVGSAVLMSLFMAIKFLPKKVLTLCLGLYFVLLGTMAITATVLPFVDPLFPKFIKKIGISFKWVSRLPKWLTDLLDGLETVELSAVEFICGLISLGFCSWYHVKRHWVANNVIGIALSVQGIEMLSLGSVQVGCILLCGLFFYDIFWVFFTPVMVTVATSFEAPIKLLFLRGLAESGKPKFSMLGLGDIVIPGIYLALLLRLDHSRNFKSNYFKVTFISYCLGLVATIAIMNIFMHAQPALLYLVPAVLGSTFLLALKRGEVSYIFNWSEVSEEETQDASHETDKKEK